jgi:hypothetical protein
MAFNPETEPTGPAMPRFTETAKVTIDSVHSREICEEIGYRLRRACVIDASVNPRHRLLLDRLSRRGNGATAAKPPTDGKARRPGSFAGELLRTFTLLGRRRG